MGDREYFNNFLTCKEDLWNDEIDIALIAVERRLRAILIAKSLTGSVVGFQR